MTKRTITKVIHGGSGKRQFEKTEKNVLDFSASINPFPPRVQWDCGAFNIGHYPDDNYTLLKDVIAKTFRRHPEEVCVGNGSIELIRVSCRVLLLRKSSTFRVENPTFGEYAYSAILAGGKEARPGTSPDLLFICNPNNPTGTLRSCGEMKILLEEQEESGGFLCADEAFIELADPAQSLAGTSGANLLILRSLTKCFSVPGIRFGYGFGNPELIEKIEASRLPWTVNAYAEAFALQAFRHFEELDESRRRIAAEREILADALGSLGLSCTPSSANFLLVETGRPVSDLCSRLQQKGILVRDCTSFGLPTRIRIAIRTRQENRCLVEELPACLP